MTPAPTDTALSLDVHGMTCASCVRRVERALAAVPGVTEATVNLATERASVKLDVSSTTSLDQLRAAVERIGYTVADDPPAVDPSVADAVDPREAQRTRELRALARKAVVSLAVGFAMMAAMFVPGHHPPRWLAIAELVAATVVQVWAAGSIYRAAYNAARHATTDMNTLVAIGTSVAFGSSAFAAVFPNEAIRWGISTHLSFESSVLIVAFVLLGRWLEARARRRAGEAVRALTALQPRTARVLRAGDEVDVLLGTVRVGDLVRVRAGETVPVDGVVATGESFVDESMLTGESAPVRKSTGARITSATRNHDGTLVFRVDRTGNDTALAQIVKLVEDAQGSKAPLQQFADRVASVFVPVMLVLAVLTFAAWMLFGPAPHLPHALGAAIAVLVVACPCALGLATPTALMAGTGRAAEMGILVRSADALERARRVDTVVFDKTGTLTAGAPTVTRVVCLGDTGERTLVALAASAETGSEHPLGGAIVAHARANAIGLDNCTQFVSRAGRGVQARVADHDVLVGNRVLLAEARRRRPRHARARRRSRRHDRVRRHRWCARRALCDRRCTASVRARDRGAAARTRSRRPHAHRRPGCRGTRHGIPRRHHARHRGRAPRAEGRVHRAPAA